MVLGLISGHIIIDIKVTANNQIHKSLLQALADTRGVYLNSKWTHTIVIVIVDYRVIRWQVTIIDISCLIIIYADYNHIIEELSVNRHYSTIIGYSGLQCQIEYVIEIVDWFILKGITKSIAYSCQEIERLWFLDCYVISSINVAYILNSISLNSLNTHPPL